MAFFSAADSIPVEIAGLEDVKGFFYPLTADGLLSGEILCKYFFYHFRFSLYAQVDRQAVWPTFRPLRVDRL
jgi:hypothetical protein